MKVYITFGQVHTHSVNGKTFDKDCVAVINCITYDEGSKLILEYFDNKFCMAYEEAYWNEDDIKYYPRGYIEM